MEGMNSISGTIGLSPTFLFYVTLPVVRCSTALLCERMLVPLITPAVWARRLPLPVHVPTRSHY